MRSRVSSSTRTARLTRRSISPPNKRSMIRENKLFCIGVTKLLLPELLSPFAIYHSLLPIFFEDGEGLGVGPISAPGIASKSTETQPIFPQQTLPTHPIRQSPSRPIHHPGVDLPRQGNKSQGRSAHSTR